MQCANNVWLQVLCIFREILLQRFETELLHLKVHCELANMSWRLCDTLITYLQILHAFFHIVIFSFVFATHTKSVNQLLLIALKKMEQEGQNFGYI